MIIPFYLEKRLTLCYPHTIGTQKRHSIRSFMSEYVCHI